MLARLQAGVGHLEQGVAAYDAAPVDADRFQTGNDPGVVCHAVAGMLLWMSGFPDQARDRADDAIRLAERLHHPPSTAYAHFHTGLIRMWRREPVSAREHAQRVVEISDLHELPVWRAVGSCLRGAAVAATGAPEEGLALFQAAVDQYRALKTPPVFWAPLLQLHAAVCGMAGRPTEGLALVDEALDVIAHDAGPELSSSELFILKGELTLARSGDDMDEAEGWLRRAVESADQMDAPMLQLRATLALARVWSGQGKLGPAQESLREAYARLTEGFATADLLDAAQLLDELAATGE
jgi:adenylate cyclase